MKAPQSRIPRLSVKEREQLPTETMQRTLLEFLQSKFPRNLVVLELIGIHRATSDSIALQDGRICSTEEQLEVHEVEKASKTVSPGRRIEEERDSLLLHEVETECQEVNSKWTPEWIKERMQRNPDLAIILQSDMFSGVQLTTSITRPLYAQAQMEVLCEILAECMTLGSDEQEQQFVALGMESKKLLFDLHVDFSDRDMSPYENTIKPDGGCCWRAMIASRLLFQKVSSDTLQKVDLRSLDFDTSEEPQRQAFIAELEKLYDFMETIQRHVNETECGNVSSSCDEAAQELVADSTELNLKLEISKLRSYIQHVKTSHAGSFFGNTHKWGSIFCFILCKESLCFQRFCKAPVTSKMETAMATVEMAVDRIVSQSVSIRFLRQWSQKPIAVYFSGVHFDLFEFPNPINPSELEHHAKTLMGTLFRTLKTVVGASTPRHIDNTPVIRTASTVEKKSVLWECPLLTYSLVVRLPKNGDSHQLMLHNVSGVVQQSGNHFVLYGNLKVEPFVDADDHAVEFVKEVMPKGKHHWSLWRVLIGNQIRFFQGHPQTSRLKRQLKVHITVFYLLEY